MAELRKKSFSRRKSSTKPVGMATQRVKCAILGDGNVGKSAMLITFLTGTFPETSSPGPIDGLSEVSHLVNKPVSIVHDNTEVQLTLVDTYGQDEYDRLRERVCGQADVYILCYDVSRRATLERLGMTWLPEIREYSAPGVPFVVAGLKTDIRSKALAGSDDMEAFVTFSKGKKEAAAMGAAFYAECSAHNNFSGVKNVFEMAARAAADNAVAVDGDRSSCVLS